MAAETTETTEITMHPALSLPSLSAISAQAQGLSRQQIWEAIPEQNRTEAVRQDLSQAGPTEAVNIYKSCFWQFSDGSMQRLIEPVELLPLMMGLYLQKGGDSLAQEIEMWSRLFKLELGD